MAFKIIADSSCDMPGFYGNTENIKLVPFKITLEGTTYIDDGSINIAKYIEAMKNSKNPPVSACPSPSDFLEAMGDDGDDVFVVTISEGVSATYQSAVMAGNMRTSGRTHVFNSLSAAAGEVIVAYKLLELIKNGDDYDTIVEKTEAFIKNTRTFFVLQSLDNLIKAGRISRIKGQLASILNMRPIMSAADGKIFMLEKARGTAAAMEKLIDIVIARAEEMKDTLPLRDTMIIAHCNCLARAEALKKSIMKRAKMIKNVIIVSTGGLSTNYANDGGVIIAL